MTELEQIYRLSAELKKLQESMNSTLSDLKEIRGFMEEAPKPTIEEKVRYSSTITENFNLSMEDV